MSHLEDVVDQYYRWQGYHVERNVHVGRLAHGGWEMELDIVAHHQQTGHLVQLEPSIDADAWAVREERFAKKFAAGRKYIFSEVMPWLDAATPLEQIAVLVSHPRGRDSVGGGSIRSIDELMAEIRRAVLACGPAVSNAIPERYPLLRTLQLSHVGYARPIPSE